MPPASRRDRLRRLLREAGLRVTGARLAVLHAVAAARLPLTHAEVSASLNAVTVDHSTIYRVLQDLLAAGLLIRSNLGDRVWRFSLQLGHGAPSGCGQAHFICAHCGSVARLPASTFSTIKASAAVPDSVRPTLCEIRLRGLCTRCQRPPKRLPSG